MDIDISEDIDIDIDINGMLRMDTTGMFMGWSPERSTGIIPKVDGPPEVHFSMKKLLPTTGRKKLMKTNAKKNLA